KPSIFCIRISRIRHSVSLTRPDSRNSWADANTSALKPNELMSLCADFRAEASSSTIETRGLSAALTFTFIEPNILAPEAESILLDLRPGESRPLAWESQVLGHADQISQRFRQHFVHDVTAMKLDSFLSGSQFRGDLFIEHSRNDTRRHFALTRRKKYVTRTQPRQLSLQVARSAIAPNRLLDGVEQILLAKRLGKKPDRTGFHRLQRHRDITVTRNEDDRNLNAGCDHLPLQIQAAQPGQTHVEQYARGCFRTRVAQKFSSRRERLNLIPHRQNQTLGGTAERRIVVDDDYDGIGINHASPLPSAEKAISVVDDVRRSLDHFALKDRCGGEESKARIRVIGAHERPLLASVSEAIGGRKCSNGSRLTRRGGLLRDQMSHPKVPSYFLNPCNLHAYLSSRSPASPLAGNRWKQATCLQGEIRRFPVT